MCSELPLGVDVLIYSAPLGRILSLISLLRELAVSELPTGSDEVRKEADPVFRAIGKRFRDVRPIGVCIAPPDGLRSTAPAVDIWYSGAEYKFG